MCPLSPLLSAAGIPSERSLSRRDPQDRFEPSQALAVSLKKAQYWNAIDLPADDERILHYLKGETIEIEPEEAKSPKGWQLLCVSGYPLGWGKLVNGLLKNKFLASWRLS